MLGYVQIYKPDLKVREYEIYQAYYCGVCKYIGREYGQLPRMSLSYDAAFLAILLASVIDEPDEPTLEHCVVHHIKKKTIVRNRAIEYAGDVMLILAWYKLLDDVHDEGKRSAKATMLVLRKIHKKLMSKYPALCDGVEINLTKLSALEDAHCSSLDEAADCFSKIMEVIFSEGSKTLHGLNFAYENVPERSSVALHEIFAKIGYHMGKWIYLIDAVDDIEENIDSGAYNPLLYRFNYAGGILAGDTESVEARESIKEFRERIRGDLEFNLYQYLAVLGESLSALDIKKNSGIINNVIYFGLNKKT